MRPSIRRFFVGALGIAMLFVPSAGAVEVELVSRRAPGLASVLGETVGLELSADGQWTALTVSANRANELAYSLDVFVQNTETGETFLASRTAEGVRGDDASIAFGISGDGRFTVFESTASNLVAGDDNAASDVFIFDRTTGQLAVASRTAAAFGNGDSFPLGMSPDARFVVFESDADNLVSNDHNDTADIFLFDRADGTIKLVTQSYLDGGTAPGAIPGQPLEASVSADGRFVAFLSSATDLDLRQPLEIADAQVYLRDMQLGTNRWLNSTIGTRRAGRLASSPAISQNGALIAYVSADLDIGPAELQPSTYLYYYVRDGVSVRNSEPAALDHPAVHEILDFDATADGQWMVALARYSATGRGGVAHALEIHDTTAHTNGLVTLTGAGDRPRGTLASPRVSDDGKYIFFLSDSLDLPGARTNPTQLYRHNLAAGITALVSTQPAGGTNWEPVAPHLDSDGSHIAYLGTALRERSHAFVLPLTNPVAPRELGVLDSRGTTAPGNGASTAEVSNYQRPPPHSLLSADGRFAAFVSYASDLTPNDTNGAADVFVRDLRTHQTHRVSTMNETNRMTAPVLVGMSRDGSRIAWGGVGLFPFYSGTLWVYDTRTGENVAGSVLPDGAIGSISPGLSMFSPNGNRLFFSSPSSYYLRDLEQGTTIKVPVIIRNVTKALTPAGHYLVDYDHFRSRPAAVFDTARWSSNAFAGIYLGSTADDSTMLFSQHDAVGKGTLFLYDPARNSSNQIATNVDLAIMSEDGSTVVYRELPPAGESQRRAFIHDVARNTRVPLLLGANGSAANVTRRPALSYDGRFVAFVAEDDAEQSHLYIWDRSLKKLETIRGMDGRPAELISSDPWISADGQTVLFESLSPGIVPGDWNLATDVFVARLGQALRVQVAGGEVRVFWKHRGGQLQIAPTVTGEWTTLQNAAEPHLETASGSSKFFRVLHQ